MKFKSSYRHIKKVKINNGINCNSVFYLTKYVQNILLKHVINIKIINEIVYIPF